MYLENHRLELLNTSLVLDLFMRFDESKKKMNSRLIMLQI